ncbi:MAG: zinc ribbon domain-containing protein [Thermodesulfobacteriota bacterium]
MPIYEFQCQECQKKFETLLTSSARINEVNCPDCQSQNIKKVISSPSSLNRGKAKVHIPAGALSGCSSRGGFS